jgi:endonuclease/exonuclease/phosphatase family metal-dependent hydrolase
MIGFRRANRHRWLEVTMRRGLVGVLVCATVALGAPAKAEETAGRDLSLRVVTYNIQAGAGMDRRFDVGRQIEALRAIDADIISLQEVDVRWSARSEWRDLATEIAGALGMNVFFGHIYESDPPNLPPGGFGIAMLSRYPILAGENHEITRLSTQVPDPKPEPAPGFPEILVNARGAHIHVYGTHLDFRADPAVRQMQVADMLQIMARDQGRRQILLGDFNARPDAPELAPLWQHVADAWARANGPDGGLTFPADVPDRRIDYVTVSPRLEVREAAVPQTFASDHLPVIADLIVKRGENDAP